MFPSAIKNDAYFLLLLDAKFDGVHSWLSWLIVLSDSCSRRPNTWNPGWTPLIERGRVRPYLKLRTWWEKARVTFIYGHEVVNMVFLLRQIWSPKFDCGTFSTPLFNWCFIDSYVAWRHTVNSNCALSIYFHLASKVGSHFLPKGTNLP